MDIFSFGVLLIEMLTGEFPGSDERTRLLLSIFDQPLLALIQRCLKDKKEDRPCASEVILELDC
jgi:serine/threonine protein kinase